LGIKFRYKTLDVDGGLEEKKDENEDDLDLEDDLDFE